jgi:hypothetical protein
LSSGSIDKLQSPTNSDKGWNFDKFVRARVSVIVRELSIHEPLLQAQFCLVRVHQRKGCAPTDLHSSWLRSKNADNGADGGDKYDRHIPLVDILVLGRCPEQPTDPRVVFTGITENCISRKQATVRFVSVSQSQKQKQKQKPSPKAAASKGDAATSNSNSNSKAAVTIVVLAGGSNGISICHPGGAATSLSGIGGGGESKHDLEKVGSGLCCVVIFSGSWTG